MKGLASSVAHGLYVGSNLFDDNFVYGPHGGPNTNISSCQSQKSFDDGSDTKKKVTKNKRIFNGPMGK